MCCRMRITLSIMKTFAFRFRPRKRNVGCGRLLQGPTIPSAFDHQLLTPSDPIGHLTHEPFRSHGDRLGPLGLPFQFIFGNSLVDQLFIVLPKRSRTRAAQRLQKSVQIQNDCWSRNAPARRVQTGPRPARVSSGKRYDPGRTSVETGDHDNGGSGGRPGRERSIGLPLACRNTNRSLRH